MTYYYHRFKTKQAYNNIIACILKEKPIILKQVGSRRGIKRLVQSSRIGLNQNRLLTYKQTIGKGDIIEININPNNYKIDPIKYIAKTNKLIVVNKPSGILSTDFEWYAHRLDKDTSGILLCGNGLKHLRIIESFFRSYKVNKAYLTITYGNMKEDSIWINELNPLNKFNRTTVAKKKSKRTRTAITIVKHIYSNDEYQLLLCIPITGRTHQIRIQAAYQGFNICGDKKYTDMYKNYYNPNPLMLHSWINESPYGQFCCPAPKSFKNTFKTIFGKSINDHLPNTNNIFDKMYNKLKRDLIHQHLKSNESRKH